MCSVAEAQLRAGRAGGPGCHFGRAGLKIQPSPSVWAAIAVAANGRLMGGLGRYSESKSGKDKQTPLSRRLHLSLPSH
jgi:hypothetical protein